MIHNKVWGTTECLHSNDVCEIHRLDVKAGFQCSRHFHSRKHNLFHVVSGRLKVEVFRDNGIVDETILGPGETTAVKPLEIHRFACLEDCVCIEYYWCEIGGEDITRYDVGGPIQRDEKPQEKPPEAKPAVVSNPPKPMLHHCPCCRTDYRKPDPDPRPSALSWMCVACWEKRPKDDKK